MSFHSERSGVEGVRHRAELFQTGLESRAWPNLLAALRLAFVRNDIAAMVNKIAARSKAGALRCLAHRKIDSAGRGTSAIMPPCAS